MWTKNKNDFMTKTNKKTTKYVIINVEYEVFLFLHCNTFNNYFHCVDLDAGKMKRKNVFLKKKLKLSVYIFLIIFFFIYLTTNFLNDFFDEYLSNDLTFNEIIESPIETSVVLRSKCECLKEYRVDIRKDKHFYYSSVILENKYASRISRIVSRNEFETYNITCNIFDTLRRGKHQKIIVLTQVSLESILYFAKQAKLHYPDWIVRVYYSDEIKLSNRCFLQCLKNDDDENEQIFDNVDFCHYESKYINTFRYIAVADSFVSQL